MSYKIFIYILAVFLSAFALSGINFDGFIKKNRVWEARILFILLSLALGYLVGSFVIEFTEVSIIT